MTRAALVLLGVAVAVLWPLSGAGATRPWGRSRGPATDRRRLAGRVRALPARWPLRRGRRQQVEDETAELLAVLAPPLRAGASPLAALRAVRGLHDEEPLGPLVAGLVRSAQQGRPLAEEWLHHAGRLDSSALRFVGTAWSVSEATGAPLADALECAEQVLRQRRRAAERLRSAAAGPRASMTVLALLPLSGPLVGLACGVAPRELYLSSPVAGASVLLGAVWAAVAWVWARRIVRAAT